MDEIRTPVPVSFEFFPPNTPVGSEKLRGVVKRACDLNELVSADELRAMAVAIGDLAAGAAQGDLESRLPLPPAALAADPDVSTSWSATSPSSR